MSVVESVKTAIAKAADVDRASIQLWSKLGDGLGLDSLDKVEIAFHLEHEFDIELDDADLEKAVTVNDLVELVESKRTRVAA